MEIADQLKIEASLEQLSEYGPFIDFCELLLRDSKETINDKMRNSEKITSEDYAKVKIYNTLGELPKKRLAILKATRQKTKNDIELNPYKKKPE